MGHKEYATPAGRKTDPHTLNMNTVRATVKTIGEDEMTPEQEAKLDELKALILKLPTATWKYPQKDDPSVLSAYQLQSRTKEDSTAIRLAVGALEMEGVSEADLDERVAELKTLISAQPPEFVAALKAAL
jgi:hypothetical protein